MDTMAPKITSFMIVYSTVYSSANQTKYQSSASLAFVRGFHRFTVNSPHKEPVTRKISLFDDVIMRVVWDSNIRHLANSEYVLRRAPLNDNAKLITENGKIDSLVVILTPKRYPFERWFIATLEA